VLVPSLVINYITYMCHMQNDMLPFVILTLGFDLLFSHPPPRTQWTPASLKMDTYHQNLVTSDNALFKDLFLHCTRKASYIIG